MRKACESWAKGKWFTSFESFSLQTVVVSSVYIHQLTHKANQNENTNLQINGGIKDYSQESHPRNSPICNFLHKLFSYFFLSNFYLTRNINIQRASIFAFWVQMQMYTVWKAAFTDLELYKYKLQPFNLQPF